MFGGGPDSNDEHFRTTFPKPDTVTYNENVEYHDYNSETDMIYSKSVHGHLIRRRDENFFNN